MSSEKFCVRLNNFEKNISETFRVIRNDKHFTDITLDCEEKQILAHKVILSAGSTFFKKVLLKHPHAHPIIYFKDVKLKDLEAALDFMYLGEVIVEQAQFASFLQLAEHLQLKGFTKFNSVASSKESEVHGNAVDSSSPDTKDSEVDNNAVASSSPDTKDSEVDNNAVASSAPDTKDSEVDNNAVASSSQDTKDSEVHVKQQAEQSAVVTSTRPLNKRNRLSIRKRSSWKSFNIRKNAIRRSDRKTTRELAYEQVLQINFQLRRSNDWGMGLAIRRIPGKGRGIITTRNRRKGEFIVEYAGEIINMESAKERENEYSMDVKNGSFMYYFKHNDKPFCVDATRETDRLGRLINHSCKHPNMVTKVVTLDGGPRLVLVAKQDITKGTELLYDYGDRDKETIKNHPWLAT